MRSLIFTVAVLVGSQSFAATKRWIPRISSSGTIPGIFVDSVAGSDSNAGTSNAPFATSRKVNQVLGFSATTNIYFKRGGIYRQFQIPTNSTVDCYGTSGSAPDIYSGVVNSKPVFSGAVHIPTGSITKTGGRTIVYQATMTSLISGFVPCTNVQAGLVSSNVLMVWQNNVRVGNRWDLNAGAGGIASVDGGAGRFYYDTATKIIYFSTNDGSDPSATGFYEVSFDTLCLFGGDNVTVKNLIAEKSYSYDGGGGEGYGIFAFGSGTYLKCTGRYGYNHNVGVANSVASGLLTFDSCIAQDAATGTMFVAYKDAAATLSSVLFTNCLAQMAQTNLSIAGYLAHDAGGATVSASFKNCYALNCLQGWSWNSPAICAAFSGNTAEACLVGVDVSDNTPILNFTNYFSAQASGSSAIQLESSTTSNAIIGGKFIFTNDSRGIVLGGVSTRGYVTNCIFANGGTRAGTALQGTSGPQYNCWSNNFVNVNYGYIDGSYLTGSGDYNNYFSTFRIGDMECCSNPSPQFWTQANLAGWKTAWAGVPVDQNATATDPGYAAGFYTFTVPDPTGGDAN